MSWKVVARHKETGRELVLCRHNENVTMEFEDHDLATLELSFYDKPAFEDYVFTVVEEA